MCVTRSCCSLSPAVELIQEHPASSRESWQMFNRQVEGCFWFLFFERIKERVQVWRYLRGLLSLMMIIKDKK